MKLIKCSIVSILVFIFTATYADDVSTNKTQLSKVNQQISSLKKTITTDQSKQDKLNAELKTSEKNIGTISKRLSDLQKQITSQNNQLKSLEKKLNGSQRQLIQQRQLFSEQLKANYIMTQQGQLGLYLSDQNPNDTQRFLQYYRSLDRAQIKTINSLQNTIEDYNKTAKDIKTNTARLQSLYKEQKTKQSQAKRELGNREKIIKSLNADIAKNNQQLGQLSKNQSNLTKVVTHLKPAHVTGSFANQRNALRWPVSGKLLAYYGMAATGGNWQGDLISAPLNTPVKAIFSGKIIYADWLRGYGLLIIIDHGNGYMSLYGRNNSLYAKVGDQVNTGDVIAKVGRSGGFETPALYFEVRHNGKSIPTSSWFTTTRPPRN